MSEQFIVDYPGLQNVTTYLPKPLNKTFAVQRQSQQPTLRRYVSKTPLSIIGGKAPINYENTISIDRTSKMTRGGLLTSQTPNRRIVVKMNKKDNESTLSFQ